MTIVIRKAWVEEKGKLYLCSTTMPYVWEKGRKNAVEFKTLENARGFVERVWPEKNRATYTQEPFEFIGGEDDDSRGADGHVQEAVHKPKANKGRNPRTKKAGG